MIIDRIPGALLKRQLRKAKDESLVQDQVFEIFSSRLPSESVVEWIAEVEAFERDHSLPDPYYREIKGKPVLLLVFDCILTFVRYHGSRP